MSGRETRQIAPRDSAGIRPHATRPSLHSSAKTPMATEIHESKACPREMSMTKFYKRTVEKRLRAGLVRGCAEGCT